MRLVISAGGTGGHIYPALAIVKKFQEKEKDLEVLYIGTHNRMENEIVPKHNIPYKSIKIYGFSKQKIGQDILNVGYLINAYHKCVSILKEFKPDVVIGVGGYVTMPVIMAAKKLKIKSYIHEQNCIPGKTNKFLSKGVRKVFTSYEDSQKYFPEEVKCVYTGNPCSDNVITLKSQDKTTLGLSKNKKLILVVAGSLGSKALNDKMVSFLELSKDSDYEVLYITGADNYNEFKKNKFSKNIFVLPYLDNLAALLKACDLVISRSGAGITSEIIASKVPSILIPSPNVANNHQYYNAKDLSDKKLAIMINEKDLDSLSLFNLVKNLLSGKDKRLKEIKENLSMQKIISSSDMIYKNIKDDLNG